MLVVKKSLHGLPCVELMGAEQGVRKIIRDAVLCDLMDDPRYRLGQKAGAFLQGEDERSGWVLVEFWRDDYQPFVDLLNELIKEEEAKCSISSSRV